MMPYQKKAQVKRIGDRGAALIAALMLSMVLSAVGVMALQSTMRSLNMSGNYRLRMQAQTASDSAVQFVSQRVGNKASVYWRFMAEKQRKDALNTGALGDARASIARGAYMVVDPNSFNTGANPTLSAPSVSGETGLFSTTDDVSKSHESGRTAQNAYFQVVLRDPIEGPSAPGSDGRFCFKKVTFFSQYVYGEFIRTNNSEGFESITSDSRDWARPAMSALGRNGLEGMIGPIECGSR